MTSGSISCQCCGAMIATADRGGLCDPCLLVSVFGDDDPPVKALPSEEQVGDVIDHFVLEEAIGEGGMGRVWRARQTEPLQRTVALKIVKLGMDTREVVRRFEAERQALALMNHASIAAVFDAGATASGRPYFVMELVKGEPLTDYCARRKLPIGERLDLFQQVCAAVQHAHAKGIVHRDLKPSNVIAAGDEGERCIKVIDFGIAKALEPDFLDRTQYTLEGHVVGTPGYMSPEQAGATPDIDVRSDVYALGALLYELLSGSPPFTHDEIRQAGIAEILRIIREDDPPKPSQRLSQSKDSGNKPGVHGQLDTIVMKALARDRDQRYPTVTDLAKEIDGFLSGKKPLHSKDSRLGFKVTAIVLVIVLAVITLKLIFSGEDEVEEAVPKSEASLVASQSLIFTPSDPPRVIQSRSGEFLLQKNGVGVPMVNTIREANPPVVRLSGEWSNDGIDGLTAFPIDPRTKRPLRIDHTVHWFPFAEGWLGGHLRLPVWEDGSGQEKLADIDWLGSDKISIKANDKPGTDREFQVEIENIDSRSDGLLFPVCATGLAGDESQRELFIPLIDRNNRGGWDVRLGATIGHARPESYFSNARHFSLLFVPWKTPGLIGGGSRDDMEGAKRIGDYVVTPQVEIGRWMVRVGNEEERGSLLLTPGGDTAARVAHLAYQKLPGHGKFMVELRDLTTGELCDGDWFFIWLPEK